jgi:hypothetical protein
MKPILFLLALGLLCMLGAAQPYTSTYATDDTSSAVAYSNYGSFTYPYYDWLYPSYLGYPYSYSYYPYYYYPYTNFQYYPYTTSYYYWYPPTYSTRYYYGWY